MLSRMIRSKAARSLAPQVAQRGFVSKKVWAHGDTIKIVELMGDGIGPELSQSVHQVVDKLPIKAEFIPVDWSIERRQDLAEQDRAVAEAYKLMDEHKVCIKYPTVTKQKSPNALIRRMCDFSVIYRPAISIDGIDSNFKENVDMHIVRIATGGTYDDPGQMIGNDAAVSLRMVERKPCTEAAKFAFELGRTKGMPVTSASKHTIQRVTDGFFEKISAQMATKYPDVPHNVELFDALLGKVILDPSQYKVVVCLNEYGDFLSDLASGLVGSLGTGASGNYSFNEDQSVNIAMFDPAGGTAPDIAGQNKANPTAIFLALGMLLDHVGRYDLGHALRLSTLDAVKQGNVTQDLGGKLGTAEFTQVVVDRLPIFMNTNARTLKEFYEQN